MLNSLCLLLPVAYCHNMLQPQCCQFFHFQLPKQLRSRWWICRVLLCCKEYFPPTSPFRFRTFSPLILVVNLIQPFHFYYAVVSLSCNKANLVLFSVRFDTDHRNPNMPPHPNPVQRGNWLCWSQTYLGLLLSAWGERAGVRNLPLWGWSSNWWCNRQRSGIVRCLLILQSWCCFLQLDPGLKKWWVHFCEPHSSAEACPLAGKNGGGAWTQSNLLLCGNRRWRTSNNGCAMQPSPYWCPMIWGQPVTFQCFTWECQRAPWKI